MAGESKVSRGEVTQLAEAMAKALVDMGNAIAAEIRAMAKRVDALEKKAAGKCPTCGSLSPDKCAVPCTDKPASAYASVDDPRL